MNPFASHRIEELGYRFRGEDWAEALERLRDLDFRAAIVGPEGKGKTTLLFELEAKLRDAGEVVRLERLTPDGDRKAVAVSDTLPGTPQPATECEFVEPSRCALDVSPDEILMIDSAGLLSARERLRVRFLTRKARGVIVTSHEETWLPTWVTCGTTRDQFLELVEELVGHSVNGVHNHLVSVYDRHEGNVRSAFRELYDRFAEPSLDDPFGVTSS